MEKPLLLLTVFPIPHTFSYAVETDAYAFFPGVADIPDSYYYAHQLKAHLSLSRNAVMIKDHHQVARRNKVFIIFDLQFDRVRTLRTRGAVSLGRAVSSDGPSWRN